MVIGRVSDIRTSLGNIQYQNPQQLGYVAHRSHLSYDMNWDVEGGWRDNKSRDRGGVSGRQDGQRPLPGFSRGKRNQFERRRKGQRGTGIE